MQSWYHLRALALLGALIMYFMLWPINCCTAKPTAGLLIDLRMQQIIASNNETNSVVVMKNSSDKIGKNELMPPNIFNANNIDISDKNIFTVNKDRTELSNHEKVKKENISAPSTKSSIYEIFELSTAGKNISLRNQVLSRTDRSIHLNSSDINSNNFVIGAKRVKNNNNKNKASTLDRNERSANLSHISGSARKIQLYIKNRFLQLLPDGTVNGTTDDTSDYTILQRTTHSVGQIKIQGVATCLFLCMDSCGTTYGSAEFTDDCIFNESIEQHHYNTYSSTHHSNSKRTLYLGLNRHGQPRKIQIAASRQLGKLATYTKSLTQTVALDRVEKLIAKLFGANHVKHGLKQLCDTGRVLRDILAKGLKNKPKCNSLAKPNNNNNKKKKKKRKCREDEAEGDHCIKASVYSISNNSQNNTKTSNSIINVNKKKPATNQQQQQQQQQQHQQNKKCANNEDCIQQKTAKKKPTKKQNQSKSNAPNNGNKPKLKKKNTKSMTTTTTSTTTTHKPDDEEIDPDMENDEALTSNEFNDDDDWDEMNLSHSAGHVSAQFIGDEPDEFDV